MNPVMRMLIGVDGSEHAQRAIIAAAGLHARMPGSEVVLMNVRAWPLYLGELPPLNYEAVDAAEARRQQDLLQTALESARRAGILQVTTEGARGDPAAEIVRVARRCEADMIVLGTHGRGALGSLLIGSVAQRVVHLSEAPVLLVK